VTLARAARPAQTVLLTLAALLAFAANSLLCRLALEAGLIDAASFTSVRLLSGAAVLYMLAWSGWRRRGRPPVAWLGVATLFTYMIFFSFAYLSLNAGTGALILFGAVQLTMFGAALRAGEHFSRLSWMGLGLAVAGLIYLVLPGVSAPDPAGALLMAIAGVAWGLYSLAGRRASDPVGATANNFIFATPLALLASLWFASSRDVSPMGLALAVASGAVASALGYVIWYAALRELTGTLAATVQLSVPILAAMGGVIFLAEPVTLRLLVATGATLGGVTIVVIRRSARTRRSGG
jgi:drug/metabolite transporter (DMT)-like permease